MNAKIFVLLTFCVNLLLSQPVPRSCTAAQNNVAVAPTPFNCGGANAQRPPCNVNGATPSFLNCPSKEVLTGVGGPCGGGGNHAFWFTNQMFDSLGCRAYIFTQSQGVSSGLFNEVDDNNDGIYDRASLTGTLQCDGNSALVRRMSVDIQLTLIARPGIKNELTCANRTNYPNFWYYYGSSSISLNVTDAVDATFVGTVFSFSPVAGKSFQVGLGASMKNLRYGLTTWLTLTGVSIPSGRNQNTFNTRKFGNLRNFPINHVGDINVNLRCSTGCPDTPPPPYCGNGIVEQGEECDPPGPCCTSDCYFKNTTSVCRPVAGDCDREEYCPGNSATCPPDTFLPDTTPCDEAYGLCSVTIRTTCPGNGPVCRRFNPLILDFSPFYFTFFAFNAISFNNFIANTGDTEGRVATRNDFIVGNGYSVNDKYGLFGQTSVEPSPFALFVGRNAVWGSGQLYPIDNVAGSEGIFVGSNFSLPTGLQAYVEGRCAETDPGCANAVFDAYQAYYTTFSNTLNTFPMNVQWNIQYQGLFVQCIDRTARAYTVNIPDTQFNTITWYSLRNCNPDAVWIINVQGNGPVNFNGDHIPAIAEKTVYNIPGSGRLVTVNTEVRGNMLGPNNVLRQPGGVIKGVVVFGSVDFMLQINTVNCIDLILVSYVDFVVRPLNENNCFTVRGGYGYAVGDEIFIPPNRNDRRTVISKNFVENSDEVVVCVSGPLPALRSANSRFVSEVNANINGFSSRQDTPGAAVPFSPAPATTGAAASDAKNLAASFIVLFVSLAAFFF